MLYGYEMKICISRNFQGEAAAAGLETLRTTALRSLLEICLIELAKFGNPLIVVFKRERNQRQL